jgi:hypothetical protein
MQPREAFKIGFMARCIEEGHSTEKTAELMEKAGEGWAQAAVDAAKSIMYPAGALALATPPALGGLAAYFNNKATDTDSTDIEEIKQKELVDSYKRMTRQLEQQQRLRERKTEREAGKRQTFL